ncbi:MAG: hypothetical protein GWO20_07975 [Candidatus Korarchaeota archaeon]|nr:hypothetical protein [Candidatus Korarchaeota archaeon]NIU83430.1 hypothetical protein [Candidatus Thorarchaeota archaeon]NIW13702.1 hypothetical protein [Candidatus Thorarchaeota archaeon]NIW51801.1 hypothetical protein [Candidatus Korarchaeota archaeon]
MQYHQIQNTGITISEIGLGTEYLSKEAKDTVISVVRTAIENGVNYIDLVFNVSGFLGYLGEALEGYREDVLLATHIGSSEKNGKYRKTRDVVECEKQFYETLSQLNTSYTDVANIHYVRNEKEYKEIARPDGILHLALRLKEEGKAKAICISTHEPSVGMRAVESGKFDLVMVQVNMSNNTMPGRDKLLATCSKENVGVIAMKPFAGGKLLQRNRTVRIAQYQRGGDALKKKIPPNITPVQCLSYVLSQIGVVSTVPGVKSVTELDETLHYLNATNEEKDYSSVIHEFGEYISGQCVYCNHCLPCPSDINIGRINRLIDTFQENNPKSMHEYQALSAHASDCIQCGKCVERCPFDVDVLSRMRKAIELFEK